MYDWESFQDCCMWRWKYCYVMWYAKENTSWGFLFYFFKIWDCFNDDKNVQTRRTKVYKRLSIGNKGNATWRVRVLRKGKQTSTNADKVGPWLTSENVDFRRLPTILSTDKRGSLCLNSLRKYTCLVLNICLPSGVWDFGVWKAEGACLSDQPPTKGTETLMLSKEISY